MKKWIKLVTVLFLATPLMAQTSLNILLKGNLAPLGVGADYSDVWGYVSNDREYAILGCYTGTSIIDVTDPELPEEVAFIAGPHSIWRDIKTYGHYAYVTHDANYNNSSLFGVHVIDLSNLPESASLVARYTSRLNGGRAHNLFIEGKYLYLSGSYDASSSIPINPILDLTNPTAPVEIGSWNGTYWHDVVVQNDTIYGSAIYDKGIQIIDGTNKSDLKEISSTQYPGLFTHNIWMSVDQAYLSQTDEVHNLPVNFWDTSSPTEPNLIATYTAGEGSIAHNTHIFNNRAYISYYYDGLKILDISKREYPVEVGFYDTYPDDNKNRGFGYEGAWGAYPFLPSGNVLISDGKYGLYIVDFNDSQPGYLIGSIKDSETGLPLAGVEIEILAKPDNGTGESSQKIGNDGHYILGGLPGTYSYRLTKFGYESLTLENITFNSGITTTQDIQLNPVEVAPLVLTFERSNGVDIVSAPVYIQSADGRFEERYETSFDGTVATALPVYNDDYFITMKRWGFRIITDIIPVNSTSPISQTYIVENGFEETFNFPEEWILKDENDLSIYQWFIEPASVGTYAGRLPLFDATGDTKGNTAISRSRNPASSEDARSTLISPVFSGALLDDPVLVFSKYYNPYGWQTGAANDTLFVYLSNNNGQSWVRAYATTAIDNNWNTVQIKLGDFVNKSSAMKIKFVNSEGVDNMGRFSAFLMIDDVQILPDAVVNNVENENELASEFRLIGNYPNPFNPGTTIKWQMMKAKPVNLKIFNTLGQLVHIKSNIESRPGFNSISVDFQNQSSGIYFYQLSTDKLTQQGKMVLLK